MENRMFVELQYIQAHKFKNDRVDKAGAYWNLQYFDDCGSHDYTVADKEMADVLLMNSEDFIKWCIGYLEESYSFIEMLEYHMDEGKGLYIMNEYVKNPKQYLEDKECVGKS